MAKRSAKHSVYRFRIELREIAPLIWRQIEIPGNYTFWDLHVAIQDAMGWQDYHRHAFLPIDSTTIGSKRQIGIPIDDDFSGGQETIAGWQVPIVKHFKSPGDRMMYIYDFGDDWTHDVVLQEITSCDSQRRAACTGGERACPPEDCGGPWGYQNMLDALADPHHDQHKDMTHWIGNSFDAERFDPAMVRFDDPRARWNRAFRKT